MIGTGSPSSLLAAMASLATLLASGCSSCEPPPLGHVGKTFVAQAAATGEMPEGADVELSQLDLDAVPEAETIRLAPGKRVEWRQVRDAARALEDQGKKVALITAQRRRLGEFELYQEIEGRPIQVLVRTDGTACVRLPGVEEAKCVQRVDARHIDRAHLRQLVREAIKASKLRSARVFVPPDMEWADVVRAVDATRTCCAENMRPEVELIDLETRKQSPDEPETIMVDAPE